MLYNNAIPIPLHTLIRSGRKASAAQWVRRRFKSNSLCWHFYKRPKSNNLYTLCTRAAADYSSKWLFLLLQLHAQTQSIFKWCLIQTNSWITDNGGEGGFSRHLEAAAVSFICVFSSSVLCILLNFVFMCECVCVCSQRSSWSTISLHLWTQC